MFILSVSLSLSLVSFVFLFFQSLALRYQFLRSVSFPRPSMGSRLEDTSTSSVFTSPSHTHHTSRVRPAAHTTHISLWSVSEAVVNWHLSVCLSVSQQTCLSLPASCRPLLAAAVKGFLTRRLLRTERVSQLVRTIQVTVMDDMCVCECDRIVFLNLVCKVTSCIGMVSCVQNWF